MSMTKISRWTFWLAGRQIT